MADKTQTLSPAPARQLIVGCSPAGRITLWSADVAEFLGIPKESAVGRTPQSVANWEATNRDRAACSLLSLGSVWVFTCAVTTKTGHRFKLSTTATVALDSNGREETLYRSTIIQGSAPLASPRRRLPTWGGVQELIAFCDDRGRYTYVSQRISGALGYAPRDIIGRQVTELVHPGDQTQFTRAWSQALADPAQPQQVTARRARSDGSWATITTRMKNEFHNPAIGAMLLRGREKALAPEPPADSARRTLDAFLRNTSDGVWVLDAEGRTTYSNHKMHELLDDDGLRTEGAGGGALRNRLHSMLERPHDGDRGADGASGRGAGIQEAHDVPLDARGTRRWIRLSIASRHDDAGHLIGRMILAADVTEQREEALRAAQLISTWGRAPALPSVARTGALFTSSAEEMSRRLAGFPVTDRERLIVGEILNGDRVPAIARRHSLSQSTVRNHLASVFQKLHVGSQQELIDYLRSAAPRP